MSVVQQLIEKFEFKRIPIEGTFFTRTYFSPNPQDEHTPFGSAIVGMYSNEPRSVSLFHKLTVDEVWHFYGGDPLRLILLHPDGSSEDVILGSDPLKHPVQYVVPAGVWQAGHSTGEYSLYGCTMAPGFTEKTFTGGTRTELLERYPGRVEDIQEYACAEGHVTMPAGSAG